MKLTALATSLTLATGAFAGWQDSDAFRCGANNPHANAAINNFCTKNGQPRDHITVPSHFASFGKTVGNIRVNIRGHCNPKQWVPSYYCRNQFQSICASGANGIGMRYYGRNRCQEWSISKVHRHKRDETGNGGDVDEMDEDEIEGGEEVNKLDEDEVDGGEEVEEDEQE